MNKFCKDKICYIIGAGQNYGVDLLANENRIVIAADGGMEYLSEQNIVPDFIIGDMDSIGYKPSGSNVIFLPEEKDDTDTVAALRFGIKKGCEVFVIFGGTGGRLDHTVANLQALVFLAEQGKRGYLVDKDNIVTALKNGTIRFDKTSDGVVSVFSASGRAEKVCIDGLKYELKDATLNSSFPIGVSNCFIGKESVISVESGVLLIFYPKTVCIKNRT